MDSKFNRFKNVFAIIIASLLWGTTGTAASYAPDISSLAIGAFSMGVGGLLLVISARSTLLKDCRLILIQPKILLLGAASVAIYPLAFYSSMRLSGVAVGTIVSIATAPLFAAILERLISKKKFSIQWVISFILGASGIVFLTLGKEHSNQTSYSLYQQNAGIVLGCIAGFTYASYSWAARALIEKGVHSRSAMSGLFGCAAILLLPSLWFTGENLFSSTTNSFVSLYLAIIPMFLGYLLFAYGLKSIDASKATLITLIEPLMATALAVLIIGERFEAIGWFGAAMVSLCLLIQSLKPRAKPRLNSESVNLGTSF